MTIFFLVQNPLAGKIQKANMMVLSKEMTDKDRSLKTQLLITENEGKDVLSSEKVWKNNGFFGDIKPEMNLEKLICRRIPYSMSINYICQPLHDFEDYLHVIKDIKKFFLRNIEKFDDEFLKLQLVNSIKCGNLIILYLEKNEILVQLNRFSKDVSIPKKMYPNSARYDLYANETIKVFAGSRSLVSVDLRMIIPKGYFGRISPRSGFPLNHGIIAFSGTVDSGYTGIIYVLLFNFSITDFLVQKGNHIAQIIFQNCEEVSFVKVETVDIVSETDFGHLRKEKSILRGVKGFVSSGL